MIHIEIPMRTAGIFIAWIIPAILQSIGIKLTNYFLGHAMFINASRMQIICMFTFVLGIALILISKFVHHKKISV